MDLMGQWLLGMQGPNSTSGKGLPQEDIGILSFPIVPGGKGKATDTLGGINGWLVSKSAPPEAVDFLKFFSQEKYAKEAAASAAYIPVVKGAEASFTDPLFKHLAERSRRDDLPPELLRPGPRTVGRPRHQRRFGLGRRRRDDAGGRRRGDPGRGRAAVADASTGRNRTASSFAAGPQGLHEARFRDCRRLRYRTAETSYVEPARRMSANGWATLIVFLPPALLLFTVFVALPMAEAGWYSFYNWNGYGRPEKFIGLKNYGYLIGNATFTRSLINNGLIIAVSLLVQLPLALGDRADGGRADRRRGLVPDDLLSALCPRRRRGRADLAFHVRRQLRPAVARSRARSALRPTICSPTRPGRSPRS